MSNDDFYVVAREPGAEHPALPTWASNSANPAQLAQTHPLEVTRVDVPDVPGAFQLLNVFSPEECQRMIELTEGLGYLEDAAVSLPRKVRHNNNVVWVVDEETDGIIWQRSKQLLAQETIYGDQPPVGINARFRFYRYEQGDFFSTHIDGSWPGSRVIDGELHSDAYGDRWSQMTFLIFLSEEFEGGHTRFMVDRDYPDKPARKLTNARPVDIRTPAGAVLCFPHGTHPLHCLHGSTEIESGSKYVIRTDVLFPL